MVQFKPDCVGVHDSLTDSRGEDCLFVNIYKPSHANENSKLPVWVYIQGGGYANNADPNINGSTVVAQSNGNIVSVSFNYRVGVLGFLASDEVARNGDLNAGFLDQRKLLHWVQQHIEKFGGDPRHVVIHGDSAGGGSVSHHMTAYRGQKETELFIGAMPQSTFWPTLRTVPDMEFQYKKLLKNANCTDLDCLREMPIDQFLAAAPVEPLPGGSADPLPLWYWLPVIDGGLIPDQSYKLFGQGEFNRVPVLVANDNDEGSFFGYNAATRDQVNQFLKNNYPLLTDQDFTDINALYPKLPQLPNHNEWFPVASATYGDATFICPGNTIASSVAKWYDHTKVWDSHCTIKDPDAIANGLGTPHVFELTAVLGYGNGGGEARSFLTTNAAIVPVIMNYYISFVRSLNPNTYKYGQAPVWGAWGQGNGDRLRLETNNTAMESVPDEQVAKCDLWKRLSSRTQV